jgi:hypothetical protein
MGCAVQFNIKPNRRKSWGEHASDGWYLKTSPDHYRCHWIFVKATRAKQISDTVYFKHKYITQPTTTTDDLVIKAIHDLTIAIKDNKNQINDAQSKAITKLANALRPGNKFPIQQASERRPRVQQEQIQQKHEPLTIHPPRVQIYTPPRVRFNLGANEEQPFDANTPPQLIIESSAEKSKHQQQPKPLPILTQPKIVASESIANRVKSRRDTPPSLGQTPGQSIAERVAQRRREFASPVLDQDTGKMLEYCQLLHDPKHKKAIWSKARANEFGRLAQGVGKRIDGTNTIFFVHKHEIPQDRLKDVTYIKFVLSI